MAITILICANVRCAGAAGAEPLLDAARRRLSHHGISADVMPVKCLDLCQRGPHVVIHGARGDVPETSRAPDGGVAYDRMTEADMERLVDEHCAAGRALMDRLHQDAPGRG